MKKIGLILIIIGIAIIGFYMIYIKNLERNEKDNIDNYISDTSIVTDMELSQEQLAEENEETDKKEEKKNITINYTAVLEIPSINLKRGVVDSTKNFSSINYAISVDKSSQYPNEYGNLIMYAHSGNSPIAYFKNLTKVNINDDVYVYFNGIKYQYVIYEKYDIKKTGKAVVKSSNNDKYITLITCNQSKEGYQTVLIGKILNEENY